MPDTLVILSPAFPKDEADTSWIPPQQVFAQTLRECYPKLHIVLLSFQYPDNPGEYTWHGVEVIAFGGKGKGGLNRARLWLKVWLRLQKLHRQYRIIGLLNFWLGETAFVGSRFAKHKGLKSYSWLLGQDARAGNKYVNRIKPKRDELIAISDFVAAQYRQNYGTSPTHIIPVGVRKPALEGTPITDIDLLAAGSLIPLKCYPVFSTLVSELKKHYPNIKAVHCGTGPEQASLKALIKKLGIEDNLLLAGELPHQQVLDLMLRTKVFVHPSEYEGFSTVCLEAVYAGAQVVSFIKPMDAGISNWHIAGNDEEMLKMVKALLDSPQPKEQPETPYLVTNTVKSIMDLYNYSE